MTLHLPMLYSSSEHNAVCMGNGRLDLIELCVNLQVPYLLPASHVFPVVNTMPYVWGAIALI